MVHQVLSCCVQEETEGNLRAFLLVSADVRGLLTAALIVLMQPVSGGLWWSRGTSSHRRRQVQPVLFPDPIQPLGRREQGSLCRWDQSGCRSKAWTQRSRTHPDTRSDRTHGGASAFFFFCVGSLCLRGACDTRIHCGRTLEV